MNKQTAVLLPANKRRRNPASAEIIFINHLNVFDEVPFPNLINPFGCCDCFSPYFFIYSSFVGTFWFHVENIMDSVNSFEMPACDIWASVIRL